MDANEKRSLADLFQNKRFLYSLPVFILILGFLAWYLLGGQASSQTPIPNALNTSVPTANPDSTKKEKLDLQAQGEPLPDTPPTSGGFQANVPGSVDKYIYRNRGGSQNLAYMDSTIYGSSGRNRSGSLPRSLRPTVGSGSPLDAPLTEKDAQLTDNYDKSPSQQVDAASQAQKRAELEKAMKDRQRLITLLEEYKRDKQQKVADEGDKRKAKKVEAPDVVGSLDEPVKGAGNGFYGLMAEDAKQLQKQQLEEEVGTIRAMIYGDQTVVSSGRVKMRLLEPISLRGITIPSNTLIYGTGNFSAERVMVKVTSIQYESHILPVTMTIYDMDGMPGVYVPNIIGQTEVRQALGQSTGNINLNTYGTTGVNAAAMVGSSAANAALQGARQIVQKKTTIQKAYLKSNYYVLLRSSEPGGTSN